MTNRPDTAETFLRKWLNSSGRVAVIAGAGVSMDPPTYLPSGGDLIASIVNHITAPEGLPRSAVMKFTNPQRNDRRSPDDYLRLERILQILWDRDPQALGLLRFFADFFLPNIYHYTLAILAASGHPILTTNFDHQIEIAGEQIGFPLRSCFLESHYESLDISALPNSLLLKLHGDAVHDADSLPEKWSVAAILHDIAQGDRLWISSKWRIVREISQNFDTIVLGYSGSDDFDVIPTLIDVETAKRVLWIQHGSSNLLWSPERMAQEPGDATGAPLFPAARAVDELQRRRGLDRVALIEMPTTSAIEAMGTTLAGAALLESVKRASSLLQRALPHHARWHSTVQQKLAARSQHLSKFRSIEEIVVAEMLMSIGRVSEAESLLAPLLEEAEEAPEAVVLRCLLASQTLRRYGYHEKASSYFERAALLAPPDRLDLTEALEQERTAVNLGLGHGDTPRLVNGRNVGLSSEGFGHAAATHNTRGFELFHKGHREDARREFEKALAICQQSGDEVGVATVKNNLSLTFQHEDWGKVIEYCWEAIAIYERHRLFHAVSTARCQLGVALLESGNHAEAEKSFQEVLRLWPHNQERLNLASACHGLGVIALEEFKLRDAFVLFSKAQLLYEGSASSQTRFNLQLDLDLVKSLIPPEIRDDLERRAVEEVQGIVEGETRGDRI